LSMADWKVTATTIYCPAVDDEVTIMVYRDFSVKCTGSNKYQEPGKETARLLGKKSTRLGRTLACPGTDCPQVSEYRERLAQEEHHKENPASQPAH
jgi:hypothetical protein